MLGFCFLNGVDIDNFIIVYPIVYTIGYILDKNKSSEDTVSQVTVSFESANLAKTVKYIADFKIDELDGENRDDIALYLQQEIKRLIDGDLALWGNKDYRFFERLCHHPIQGIACLYIIGDEPKEPSFKFTVDVNNKGFEGDIVACLYTYLM